jgi:8-oxo-dGTP pyrophosphatase MutT (NUDIX family)
MLSWGCPKSHYEHHSCVNRNLFLSDIQEIPYQVRNDETVKMGFGDSPQASSLVRITLPFANFALLFSLMNYDLIGILKENLAKPLPGLEAQYRMAPKIRVPMKMDEYIKRNPAISAVLILLYPDYDHWHTVLMQRNEYEGMHSNQVSFPGGKREDSDIDTCATAIRETEEELGITLDDIEILGRLSDLYIQPSNFLVHPFIGVLNTKPVFQPDHNEVKELIETPVNVLLDPQTVKHKEIRLSDGFSLTAPYFDVHGFVVWGATAMIISEFITLFNPSVK